MLLRSSGLFLVVFFYGCVASGHNRVQHEFLPDTNRKMITKADTGLLEKLLGENAQFFEPLLKKKDELNIQIIYTQIDRKENGRILLTDHYYNVDTGRYFYPASTVKFPVALLALQRLHELKKKGLDRNTTMITEADGENQTAVFNDPSAADGCPSIAHYIKKILLVSDNDAFNRLYEFLGQEYINKTLHKMGYKDISIIHRLSVFLSEEENRHTNPVRFADTTGKTIYNQPPGYSKLKYTKQDIRLGNGFIRGDELIKEPFDFSAKNRMSVPDLHRILQSVIFPGSVKKKQRFKLTPDDYQFLYRYMSMYPRESDYPAYDSAEYPDNYVKKFLYGNETVNTDPSIRIFNKTGTAYGFLTDASYIVDSRNKIEFLLTAVIYCNSDGIFNDNKYDYDSIGYPFFKNLGKVIYEYELQRKRTTVPEQSVSLQ